MIGNAWQGMLRRWTRYRLRRELGSGTMRYVPGIERLRGYGLTVAYPDRTIWLAQVMEIIAEDCYGVQRLSPRPRVIDGGANIGMFCLWVLWKRPEARIVAVEPDERNLGYLERNLGRFLETHVQLLRAALGRTRGETILGGITSDSMRTGVSNGVRVPTLALADLLDEDVDLLKLDIEGAEEDVLAAAGGSLRRVRRVVVEAHQFPGVASHVPDILMLLRAQGFDRFRVFDNREFSPKPGDAVPEHCCLISAWRRGSA